VGWIESLVFDGIVWCEYGSDFGWTGTANRAFLSLEADDAGGAAGTGGRAKPRSEESRNTCAASLRSTIEKIVSCDRTICKFGLRGLTDVRFWPHSRVNFRLLKIC